jgi:AAA15 family ATPase/GTPase
MDSARPLGWEGESLGTRALAAVGFEAQRVLESGGVLVVDEIDASLHPYLSARIIALFQDEEQNPKGAQLIFTSHDAALLGRVRGEEVLKRDHIWFVAKDGEGSTSLYPLSDFKPRADDNRARRYLTGRYGAVPDVDDELFRDALRRREQEPEDAAR